MAICSRWDPASSLGAPEIRLGSPTHSCASAPSCRANPSASGALTEEALAYARQAGDERLVARALAAHAVSSPAADVDAEIAEIAEVAALYRKVGDFHGLAGLYSHAGYAAITQGNYQRAAVYMDEALVL